MLSRPCKNPIGLSFVEGMLALSLVKLGGGGAYAQESVSETSTIINTANVFTQEQGFQGETGAAHDVESEDIRKCDFDSCINSNGEEVPLTIPVAADMTDLRLSFDLIVPHEVVGGSSEPIDLYYSFVMESPIQRETDWETIKGTQPYFMMKALEGDKNVEGSLLNLLGDGYDVKVALVPFKQRWVVESTPKYDASTCELQKSSSLVREGGYFQDFRSVMMPSSRRIIANEFCSLTPYVTGKIGKVNKREDIGSYLTVEYSGAAPGLDALASATKNLKKLQDNPTLARGFTATQKHEQIHILVWLSYGRNYHYIHKNGVSNPPLPISLYCADGLPSDNSDPALMKYMIGKIRNVIPSFEFRTCAVMFADGSSVGEKPERRKGNPSAKKKVHFYYKGRHERQKPWVDREEDAVEHPRWHFVDEDWKIYHETFDSYRRDRLFPEFPYQYLTGYDGSVIRDLNALSHHENIKLFVVSKSDGITYAPAGIQAINILKKSLINNGNVLSRGDVGDVPGGGLVYSEERNYAPEEGLYGFVERDTERFMKRLVARTQFYYPKRSLDCVLTEVVAKYTKDDGSEGSNTFGYGAIMSGILGGKSVWDDVTKETDPRMYLDDDNKNTLTLSMTRCCVEKGSVVLPFVGLSEQDRNSCLKNQQATELVKALSTKTVQYQLVRPQ